MMTIKLVMEITCNIEVSQCSGVLEEGNPSTHRVGLSLEPRHSKVESLCVTSPRTSGPAKWADLSHSCSHWLSHTHLLRGWTQGSASQSEDMWCQGHTWTQINTEYISIYSNHKLSWVAFCVSLSSSFQCCFSAGKHTQEHLFKTAGLAEILGFLSLSWRPRALRRKVAAWTQWQVYVIVSAS